MKGIEAVAIGRAMIDQHLTQKILCWVRERVRTLPHRTVEDCPDEDLRILSRVAAGERNKAIALELHVDQSVIARRLQRIYKRLRVSRRAEAASCFMKSGRELFQDLITRDGTRPPRPDTDSPSILLRAMQL